MLKNFKANSIHLEYKSTYNEAEYNINLEHIRCCYYNKLLDSFEELITKYFNKNIFSKKKPLKRTLSNILSNFIFSQYRKKNNSVDIFFPEVTEIDFIEDVIKDYLNINNLSINNIKHFSKEFLNRYKSNYQDFLVKRINLKNTNIVIFTKNINIKTSKFIKLLPYNSSNKDYEVILYEERYNQLKERFYIKNPSIKTHFNEILYCILLRYNTLGSNNNQLAVSPKTMNKFSKNYDLAFESFASAINAKSEYFCSIYYDLEKYFGSFGNFFDCNFIEGCYNFNPPFQEDIINLGIEKIISDMSKSMIKNKKLTFIITIPVWDTEGREKFGIINNHKDMPIIKKIKECSFLKKIDAISKENFDYHDYIYNLTKNVTIQNTYMIILSNQ